MDKQQLREIGNRLREKRNELGLTREQFAELADISPGFYGQIESGGSHMSIDTLIKVSSSLHLSMDFIITGSHNDGTDTNPAYRNAVIELLENCNERDLKLAEEVLKLFLMKNN